jgi:hypothetical protein
MTRTCAFLLSLFALGCAADSSGPVEPIWGKQPCDHCMMLLSEPPPAAQALMGDGSRRFFDDVGCLAAYLAKSQVATKAAWVRGPGARGWVDAHAVHYTSGHRTPMDYGFLGDSTGLSFQEMQARVLAKAAERRAQGSP